MDPIHYIYLKKYLLTRKLPTALDEAEKRKLQKKSEFYEYKDGILFKKDRRKKDHLLHVIQKHELESILFLMHHHPIGGHFGKDVMFEKIGDVYFWPQMYTDIRNYVSGCDRCQKRGKVRLSGSLCPIPVSAPFHQIGIDFVGPLPRTPRLNRYIIVAIDYMTKWPEAKAVKKADAITVAEFLYNDIVCRHGCPQRIISDRGTHFKNNVIKELVAKLGTRHQLSTPYHPQTNGLVERFNRTLCESIGKLVEKVSDWNLLIPSILFAYRTAKNSTTKITPFYLVYGREARQPLHPSSSDELLEGTIIQRTYDLIEHLPRLRDAAVSNIQQAQDKQKTYHDAHHRTAPEFDMVIKCSCIRPLWNIQEVISSDQSGKVRSTSMTASRRTYTAYEPLMEEYLPHRST
jgi:Integrase zinc binding domain/Integrase core domain